MKKKIAIWIIMLFSTLIFAYGCGDPYVNMSMKALGMDNNAITLSLSDDANNSNLTKDITIEISGVGSSVNQELLKTTNDKVAISYNYQGNGRTIVSLTAKAIGQTSITFRSKEGSKKVTIQVSVIKALEEISLNKNFALNEGGTINLNDLTYNFIQYSPADTGEKGVSVAFADGYSDTEKVWLANYFDINETSGTVKCKAGAINEGIRQFGAVFASNPIVKLKIFATYNNDKIITSGTNEYIEVPLIKIVEDSEIKVYTNVDTLNLSDANKYVELSKNSSGAFEIAMAKPASNISDYSSLIYLIERLVTIQVGENVAVSNNYVLSTNSDSDIVIDGAMSGGVTASNTSSDYKPYSIESIDGYSHIKLSSATCLTAGTYVLKLNVDYIGFEGLYTKTITLNIIVKNIPSSFNLNGTNLTILEDTPSATLSLFKNYLGTEGTEVKINAQPASNDLTYNVKIISNNETYKNYLLFDKTFKDLYASTDTEFDFENIPNIYLFFIKHNFNIVDAVSIKLEISFNFSLETAVSGSGSYFYNYSDIITPIIIELKPLQNIDAESLGAKLKCDHLISVADSAESILLDLSEYTTNGITVQDYVDMNFEYDNTLFTIAPSADNSKLLIIPNNNLKVGSYSFKLFFKNGYISDEITVCLFKPMIYSDGSKISAEINTNSSTLLYKGNINNTTESASNLHEIIVDGETKGTYSSLSYLTLQSGGEIELNFYNYLYVNGALQKININDLVTVSKSGYFAWEDGVLTVYNNLTINREPVKLIVKYTAYLLNEGEYIQYTLEDNINIFIFDSINRVTVANEDKSVYLYEPNSVGANQENLTQNTVDIQFDPEIANLGGDCSYATNKKGVVVDYAFVDGSLFSNCIIIKNLKIEYLSATISVNIMLSDILDFYPSTNQFVLKNIFASNCESFDALNTLYNEGKLINNTFTISEAKEILYEKIYENDIIVSVLANVLQFGSRNAYDTFQITIKKAKTAETLIINNVDDVGIYFDLRNGKTAQSFDYIVYPVDAYNKEISIVDYNQENIAVSISNGKIVITPKMAGVSYLTIATKDSYNYIYNENGARIGIGYKILRQIRVAVADGSIDNPFEIKNVNQYVSLLNDLANNNFYNYILKNDLEINLAIVSNTLKINGVEIQSLVNNPAITNYIDKGFSLNGLFEYEIDGQSYSKISKISYKLSLTANQFKSLIEANKTNINYVINNQFNLGLFPVISLAGAIIKNIELDIDINVSLPKIVESGAGDGEINISSLTGINTLNIGAFSGILIGKLENCKTEGKITCNESNWNENSKTVNIGGMAGCVSYTDDSITGIIEGLPAGASGVNNDDINCDIAISVVKYQSTNLSVANEYLNVGGVAGLFFGKGETNTYFSDIKVISSIEIKDASGNLEAGNIGGIIGKISNSIFKLKNVVCYPNLRGANTIGGFIGVEENSGDNEDNVAILDSKIYFVNDLLTGVSSIDIMGYTFVGGFIGRTDGDLEISYSYIRSFEDKIIDNSSYYGNIFIPSCSAFTSSNLQYAGGAIGYATGDVDINLSYIELAISSVASASDIDAVAVIDSTKTLTKTDFYNYVKKSINGTSEINNNEYKSDGTSIIAGDNVTDGLVGGAGYNWFRNVTNYPSLNHGLPLLIKYVDNNYVLYYDLVADFTISSVANDFSNTGFILAGENSLGDETYLLFYNTNDSGTTFRANNSYLIGVKQGDNIYYNNNSGIDYTKIFTVDLSENSNITTDNISFSIDNASICFSTSDLAGNIIKIKGNIITTCGTGATTLTIYNKYDKSIFKTVNIVVANGISNFYLNKLTTKTTGTVLEKLDTSTSDHKSIYVDSDIALYPLIENALYASSSNQKISFKTYNKMGAIIEILDAEDEISTNAEVKINGVKYGCVYNDSDANNNANVVILQDISQISALTISGVAIGQFKIKITPFYNFSASSSISSLLSNNTDNYYINLRKDLSENNYKTLISKNYVVLYDLVKYYNFEVLAKAESISILNNSLSSGISADGSVTFDLNLITANVQICGILDGGLPLLDENGNQKQINGINAFAKIIDQEGVKLKISKYNYSTDEYVEINLGTDGLKLSNNSTGCITGTSDNSLVSVSQNLIKIVKENESSSSYSIVYSITLAFDKDEYRNNAGNYDFNDLIYKIEFIPCTNNTISAVYDLEFLAEDPTNLFADYLPYGGTKYSVENGVYSTPNSTPSTYIVPGQYGIINVNVFSEFSNVSYVEFKLDSSSSLYYEYLSYEQIKAITTSTTDNANYVTGYMPIISDYLSGGGLRAQRVTSQFNNKELFNNSYYFKLFLSDNAPASSVGDIKTFGYTITGYDSNGNEKITISNSLEVRAMPKVSLSIGNSNLTNDKTELQVGAYKEINWEISNNPEGTSLNVYYANNNETKIVIVDEVNLAIFIKNNYSLKGDYGIVVATQNFVAENKYYLVCDKSFSNFESVGDKIQSITITLSAWNTLNGQRYETVENLYVQIVKIEIQDITLAGSAKGENDIDNFEVLNGTFNSLELLINENENGAITNSNSYVLDDSGMYYLNNGIYELMNTDNIKYVSQIDGQTDGSILTGEYADYYIYNSSTKSFIAINDMVSSGQFLTLNSGYYKILVEGIKNESGEYSAVTDAQFYINYNGLKININNMLGSNYLKYIMFYDSNTQAYVSLNNISISVNSSDGWFYNNSNNINMALLAKTSDSAEYNYLYFYNNEVRRFEYSTISANVESETNKIFSIAGENSEIRANSVRKLCTTLYYNYSWFTIDNNSGYKVFEFLSEQTTDAKEFYFINNKYISLENNRYKISDITIAQIIQSELSGIEIKDSSNELICGTNLSFYYVYEKDGSILERKINLVEGYKDDIFEVKRQSKTIELNGNEYTYNFYSIKANSVNNSLKFKVEAYYYYDNEGIAHAISQSSANNNYYFKDGQSYRVYMIEYYFTLEVTENSTYDNPNPIYTQEQFENMSDGQHYILMNNLELENYNPKNANGKIASFDGNGYIISISNFDLSEIRLSASSINVGLFTEIASGTIIKNIILDIVSLLGDKAEITANINSVKSLTYVGTYTSAVENYTAIGAIDLAYKPEVVFGCIAGTNNGVITNAKIINSSNDSSKIYLNVLTSQQVKGSVTNVLSGALVGINNGSITNSFVGISENKTNLDNANNDEIVMNPFVFASSGEVGGIVAKNDGTISATYSTNLGIFNTTLIAQGTNSTGAFAVENNGNIESSFVSGNNISGYRASSTTNYIIESRNDISGFVYINTGTIKNAYSCVAFKTNASETAGFVFTNSGTIKNAYTTSYNIVILNKEDGSGTLAHGPFVKMRSIDDTQEDVGTYENCYYLIDKSKSETEISLDPAVAIDKESFSNANAFNGFSFSSNGTGLWLFKNETSSPSLQGTAIDTYSNRTLNGIINNTTGISYSDTQLDSLNFTDESINRSEYTFYYNYNANSMLGSEGNPLLISNAQDFVTFIIDGAKTYTYKGNTIRVFGKLNSSITDSGMNYIRQIDNLDFDLEANDNKNVLNETYKGVIIKDIIFAGQYDGNGLKIENINLTDYSTSITQSLENYGIFYQIGLSKQQFINYVSESESNYLGAYFKNINITVSEYSTKDNAKKAGVLAGSIYNSAIINAEIKGIGSTEDTLVEVRGINFAGGLAGFIAGETFEENVILTKLADININNLFVVASSNNLELSSSNEDISNVYKTFINSQDLGLNIGKTYSFNTIGDLTDNIISTINGNLSKYSYAGSVAGILISNNSLNLSDKSIETDDYRNANNNYISGIKVDNNIEVIADNAGGVFGYLGNGTIISNVEVVVYDPENTTDEQFQLIKGRNVAGGIVGENHGIILQSTLRYESDAEKSIDKNLANWNYVTGTAVSASNSLISTLFNHVGYTSPHILVAIGGIAGYNESGTIIDSYTKVPVTNSNAYIAGGIVGYAKGFTFLSFDYTTSNVIASECIGGLVGFYNAAERKPYYRTDEDGHYLNSNGEIVSNESNAQILYKYDGGFELYANHVIAVNKWDISIYNALKDNIKTYYENGLYNFVVRMPELGNQKVSNLIKISSAVESEVTKYYHNGGASDLNLGNTSFKSIGSIIGKIGINNFIKRETNGTYTYDYSNSIVDNKGFLNNKYSLNSSGQFVEIANTPFITTSNFTGVYSTTYSVLKQTSTVSGNEKMKYLADYNLASADLFSSGITEYTSSTKTSDLSSIYGDYKYDELFGINTAQLFLQSIIGAYNNWQDGELVTYGTGITDKQVDNMKSVNLFTNIYNEYNYNEDGSYNTSEKIKKRINATFVNPENPSEREENSIWKVQNSSLPEFSNGLFNNFRTITNSEELLDALKNSNSSRFYTLNNQSTDNDGVYVIEITDGSNIPNYALINTIFKGVLSGVVENNINPKIKIITGISLDSTNYGVYALLAGLDSAIIENIDFEIEINSEVGKLGKVYGASSGSAGLLASSVSLTTFNNVNFIIADKFNNDISLTLATNEYEEDLNNVKNFGLIFGTLTGSSLNTINLIIKNKVSVLSNTSETISAFIGNSISNTIYNVNIYKSKATAQIVKADFEVLINSTRLNSNENLFVGGVSGKATSVSLLNLEENLNISLKIYSLSETTIKENGIKFDLYLGGVLGAFYYSTMDNCNYKGNINVLMERANSSLLVAQKSIFVGGLCGYETYSTIKSASVGKNSKINFRADYLISYVGGFVGYNAIGASINGTSETGNYADIELIESTDNSYYVGGLIGYNINGATAITNAFNLGDIEVTSAISGNMYMGGIVGYSNGGTYNTIYNAGNLKTANNNNVTYFIGGIIGYAMGNHLDYFINYGDITYFGAVGNNIAGIVGYNRLTTMAISNGFTLGRFYCLNSNDNIGNSVLGNVNTIADSCTSSNVSNVYFVKEFYAKYNDVISACELTGLESEIDITKSFNGTYTISYAKFKEFLTTNLETTFKVVEKTGNVAVEKEKFENTDKFEQLSNSISLQLVGLTNPVALGKLTAESGDRLNPNIIIDGLVTELDKYNIVSGTFSVANSSTLTGVIVGEIQSANTFPTLTNTSLTSTKFSTIGENGIISGINICVNGVGEGETLSSGAYNPFVGTNNGRIINCVTYGEAKFKILGNNDYSSPVKVISFVNENNGEITQSGSVITYTGQIGTPDDKVQVKLDGGVIKSDLEITGFVYSNSGIIKDSYSIASTDYTANYTLVGNAMANVNAEFINTDATSNDLTSGKVIEVNGKNTTITSSIIFAGLAMENNQSTSGANGISQCYHGGKFIDYSAQSIRRENVDGASYIETLGVSKGGNIYSSASSDALVDGEISWFENSDNSGNDIWNKYGRDKNYNFYYIKNGIAIQTGVNAVLLGTADDSVNSDSTDFADNTISGYTGTSGIKMSFANYENLKSAELNASTYALFQESSTNIVIRSTKEFIRYVVNAFEGKTEINKNIYILDDLDFSSYTKNINLPKLNSGNKIIGYNVTLSNITLGSGALFAENNGTIKGIEIANSSSKGKAILTDTNNGEISYINITNCILTANSDEGTGLICGINNGTLKYIKINNCQVIGNVSSSDGRSNLGGIAGRNIGDIYNVLVGDNASSGVTISGRTNVGGIVGKNDGTIASFTKTIDTVSTTRVGTAGIYNSTITGCPEGTTIISESSEIGIGGVIGNNASTTQIWGFYAYGITVRANNYNVGGLVGYSSGLVGKIDGKSTFIGNSKITSTFGSDSIDTNLGGAIGNSINTISNIAVIDSTITYSNSSIAGKNIGGAIGKILGDASTINVLATTTGSMQIVVTKGNNIGGVIGFATATETAISYEKLQSSNVLISGVQSLEKVGGIIGYAEKSIVLNDFVSNNLTISAITKMSNVGGVVGYAEKDIDGTGRISYLNINLSEAENIGGFAGYVAANALCAINSNMLSSSISMEYSKILVEKAFNMGGLFGCVLGNLVANDSNLIAQNDKHIISIENCENNYGLYVTSPLDGKTEINLGGIAGYVEGSAFNNIVLNSQTAGLVTEKTLISGLNIVVTKGDNIGGAIGLAVKAVGDYTNGENLKLLFLTNLKITSNNSNNVGGLIGYATANVGTTSSDQDQVIKITANIAVKGNNVGGVVGYASAGTQLNKLYFYDSTITVTGNNVGGIVGYANNENISYSPASAVSIESELLNGYYYKEELDSSNYILIDSNTSYKIIYAYLDGVYIKNEAGYVEYEGAKPSYENLINGTYYYKQSDTSYIRITKDEKAVISIYLNGVYIREISESGLVEINNALINQLTINVTGHCVGGVSGYGGKINSASLSGWGTGINITATGQFVGGIVGYTNSSVTSTTLNGNINVTSNFDGSIVIISGSVGISFEAKNDVYVGGVAGYCNSLTGITQDTSKLVKVTAGKNYVGGIAGYVEGNIEGSVELYNIVVVGGKFVGGIVGSTKGLNFTSAILYNSSISATAYVGAIAGSTLNEVTGIYVVNQTNITATSVAEQYYEYTDTDTSKLIKKYENMSYASGFIGYANSKITGANITIENTIISATGNFVGGVVGKSVATEAMDNTSLISITNNTKISSTRDYIGGVFGAVLGDVNSTITSTGSAIEITGLEVSGRNFVGGVVGYTAYGLYANTTLIGKSTANIKVTGNNFVGGAIGSLGWIDQQRDGSYFISKADNDYRNIINPDAGEELLYYANYASLNKDDAIKVSATYLSVSANYNVGGLIGFAYFNENSEQVNEKGLMNSGNILSISNSFVESIQTGTDLTSAGGILGTIYGSVAGQMTVSAVQIEALSQVGGAIGQIFGDIGNSEIPQTQILISGNTGIELSGTEYLGGIAGKVNGNIINAKLAVSNYIINASSSFVGGITGSLSGNIESGELSVIGASSEYYIQGRNYVGGLIGFMNGSLNAEETTTGLAINNSVDGIGINGYDYVGGLIGLAVNNDYKFNFNFVTLNNLNISATHNYLGGAIGSVLDFETGKAKFNLIGDSTNSGNNGILINGARINAIQLTCGGNYIGGLFGEINKINLKGNSDDNIVVGISGITFIPSISSTYIGGIVGKADNSTIENLHINKDTTNWLSLANCSNNNYVGGIVGYINGESVEETTYKSQILNCNANFISTIDGKLNGKSLVGGIAGASRYTYISGCNVDTSSSVNSAITGETNIGGIAGRTDDGQVDLCNFTGKIGLNSSSYVGGIVGFILGTNGNSKVLNCETKAGSSVIGNKYVGGIAGAATASNVDSIIIDYCTNSALEVVGYDNYIAGIVGNLMRGKVTNNTNNGYIKYAGLFPSEGRDQVTINRNYYRIITNESEFSLSSIDYAAKEYLMENYSFIQGKTRVAENIKFIEDYIGKNYSGSENLYGCTETHTSNNNNYKVFYINQIQGNVLPENQYSNSVSNNKIIETKAEDDNDNKYKINLGTNSFGVEGEGFAYILDSLEYCYPIGGFATNITYKNKLNNNNIIGNTFYQVEYSIEKTINGPLRDEGWINSSSIQPEWIDKDEQSGIFGYEGNWVLQTEKNNKPYLWINNGEEGSDFKHANILYTFQKGTNMNTNEEKIEEGMSDGALYFAYCFNFVIKLQSGTLEPNADQLTMVNSYEYRLPFVYIDANPAWVEANSGNNNIYIGFLNSFESFDNTFEKYLKVKACQNSTMTIDEYDENMDISYNVDNSNNLGDNNYIKYYIKYFKT